MDETGVTHTHLVPAKPQLGTADSKLVAQSVTILEELHEKFGSDLD